MVSNQDFIIIPLQDTVDPFEAKRFLKNPGEFFQAFRYFSPSYRKISEKIIKTIPNVLIRMR